MSVSAKGLSVTYPSVSGAPVVALAEMDISIEEGEFVTIIGPSGCGKSTLLHCLGGLLTPTSGSVDIAGSALTQPDPKLAAFVFQDYTLFPWKNVWQNASIGLRFAGASKDQCRKLGLEMLELVGLSDFADAYPRELSGGMQQRVAVARAMCMDPTILLLDEPFGALDEQTRRNLGFEMAQMLGEKGRTVVLVTHSLDEAILWADRIVVMSSRPGRVVKEFQVTEPRPRSSAYVGTSEFAEIRAELYSLLQEHITAQSAESENQELGGDCH